MAKKFTNKYEMRKAAVAGGIPVPAFCHAHSISEAIEAAEKICYPVIMKAADNSGSRGIYKLFSPQEMKENFDKSISFSNNGEVIIEKILNGYGYLADGFAMGGIYHTLDVGKKENFSGHNIFSSKSCIYFSPNSILCHSTPALPGVL